MPFYYVAFANCQVNYIHCNLLRVFLENFTHFKLHSYGLIKYHSFVVLMFQALES